MRLKKSDRIRIIVGGRIIAFVTIGDMSYDLPVHQLCGQLGGAVDLTDIDEQVTPFLIISCAHLQGIHKFDQLLAQTGAQQQVAG